MELLNNIWNALTTPNECLINILSVPFTFIEAILSMFLFISILKIKSSKKFKALYIILIYTTSIISNYIVPVALN